MRSCRQTPIETNVNKRWLALVFPSIGFFVVAAVFVFSAVTRPEYAGGFIPAGLGFFSIATYLLARAFRIGDM